MDGNSSSKISFNFKHHFPSFHKNCIIQLLVFYEIISLCYKTVDYLALLAQNLRRVAYLEFELLPRICSHFRSAHQEQEGRVTPAMRLRI
ncbi:hypothetical protein WN943_004431 [Citrus x changshan-huyou]